MRFGILRQTLIFGVKIRELITVVELVETTNANPVTE